MNDELLEIALLKAIGPGTLFRERTYQLDLPFSKRILLSF